MQIVKLLTQYKAMKLKDRSKDKSVLIVRYGGFGDAIQTSCVIKSFKDRGYHVTVNTANGGENILKTDPNIDVLLVQDDGQIPNEELHLLWVWLSDKYSKMVNLCESVERSLLSSEISLTHSWSQKALHKYMNHNYVEFMCDIADTPYIPENTKFYPTEEELEWAQKERATYNKNCIMFVLSGSSMHKATPYTDNVIAELLIKYDGDVTILLTGDEKCKILEQGWEDEDRVVCKSGEWTIRESLTMAKLCTAVVGPETGVLNSVSQEPVGKVISLSHSSHENLTRDWKNTVVLEPEGCECYPCHKLHHHSDSCNINEETFAAACVDGISPARVSHAIHQVVDKEISHGKNSKLTSKRSSNIQREETRVQKRTGNGRAKRSYGRIGRKLRKERGLSKAQ